MPVESSFSFQYFYWLTKWQNKSRFLSPISSSCLSKSKTEKKVPLELQLVFKYSLPRPGQRKITSFDSALCRESDCSEFLQSPPAITAECRGVGEWLKHFNFHATLCARGLPEGFCYSPSGASPKGDVGYPSPRSRGLMGDIPCAFF